MMIICSVRPFTLSQKIIAYDEAGVIQKTILTSMKDFPENLCEMANKYNCNKVQIAGSKLYAKGLENKVKECYLAKYNKNDLEIEYI